MSHTSHVQEVSTNQHWMSNETCKEPYPQNIPESMERPPEGPMIQSKSYTVCGRAE